CRTMAVLMRTIVSNLCRVDSSTVVRSGCLTIRQHGGEHLYTNLRLFGTKQKKPMSPHLKRAARFAGIGFAMGGLATSAYLYDLYQRIKTPVKNPAGVSDYELKDKPPEFPPSRTIQVPTDSTGLKITLYQYQTCPFCCKVRAFLDYSGFNYDVVEVNSVTRTQTKWTTYRKVPFVVIEMNNQEFLQLKDSTMIISALQSILHNRSESLKNLLKSYPIMSYTNEEGKAISEIMNRYFLMYGQHPPGRAKTDILDERKWRKWVDDVYVHMLSPNVYRTMDESLQAFNWFDKAGNWEKHFATWERYLVLYVGALAMYLIGKRLKKRHQLKDDVRLSFYEETNIWLKAIKKKGTKFMGGDEPNLSDLAVYGVLMAIEGCDAFDDLKKNTKIKYWYENMKEVTSQHGGAPLANQRGQIA
ncbi:unnamed protein product, partial [Meganyctiphanes norvegica]